MKKGIFKSVWDDGIEITTPALLDEETGEVIADSVNVNGLEVLESEHFVDEDEDEIEICSTCHTYIMKSVMTDGIGKCYNEISICSDSECESNW